ncbi:MAG: pyridoxal kinase PdxY [Rhodospirillales bacterium]|jgi:pyridoxine kinase|nr:pyridoxal kinase PdxY [Rhodospirillales bacterium]
MSVLSVQSSVVLGHVGNAAAVPVLQRLGIDVWPVATVQYSNHPGYGAWRGRVTEADEIEALLAGLEARAAFPQCRAVLMGYLGSAAAGRVVLAAVSRIKKANPAAIYVLDPVMGDRDEGMYVADELRRFLAYDAVPLADVIVPNAFELEVLSERAIATTDDAISAAAAVLDRGPRMVVVTSLRASDGPTDAISVLGVTRDATWRVTTPYLKCAAKGAGDAFAALFLGHLLGGRQFKTALVRATASVFGVIAKTSETGARELALVAAQAQLVRPRHRFAAERLR